MKYRIEQIGDIKQIVCGDDSYEQVLTAEQIVSKLNAADKCIQDNAENLEKLKKAVDDCKIWLFT